MVQSAIGDACLCVMWFDYYPRCSDCRLQEGQKAQEAGGRQLFHDDVNELDNKVVRYGETGEGWQYSLGETQIKYL